MIHSPDVLLAKAASGGWVVAAKRTYPLYISVEYPLPKFLWGDHVAAHVRQMVKDGTALTALRRSKQEVDGDVFVTEEVMFKLTRAALRSAA